MIDESEAIFDEDGGFVGRYTGDPNTFDLVHPDTFDIDVSDLDVSDLDIVDLDLDRSNFDHAVEPDQQSGGCHDKRAFEGGAATDGRGVGDLGSGGGNGCDTHLHVSWLVTNATVSTDLRREYTDPSFLPRPSPHAHDVSVLVGCYHLFALVS
jgi:hypothetical protein